MSTTPPGPYPPAQPGGQTPGWPPQQPPTGPLPAGSGSSGGLPTWAGVVIGIGVGAVLAAVAVLFLMDEDDEQAATTATTAVSTAPSTGGASTIDEPEEPGGLDPVAIDAVETISESFEATAAEEECMLDAFEERPELFAALDEDELTDPALMIDIIAVAKDCLDPDELAAAFAEGMLEGGQVELTEDQAVCLSDELLDDDELLAVLVVMGLDPDAPPDPETLGPLWDLFATCDLGSALAESIQADDPTLTDEQALCLADGMLGLEADLVDELLGTLSEPGGEPSPEMLEALLDLFTTCDIDLPPGATAPTGSA